MLTCKCLKPSKRDAPTGMFLASAFGLQVAAQLAYGAPSHRHSHRPLSGDADTYVLSRANTIGQIQYPGPRETTLGRTPSGRSHLFTNADLTVHQRRQQSLYEPSQRR